MRAENKFKNYRITKYDRMMLHGILKMVSKQKSSVVKLKKDTFAVQLGVMDYSRVHDFFEKVVHKKLICPVGEHYYHVNVGLIKVYL